jgi:hypothetical protein
MNQKQRDAMRYMHRPCDLCLADGEDEECLGCATCDIENYPCDVIKVLNAWELRELEWAYDYLGKSGIHK